MKFILNQTSFNSRFKWKNNGFRSLYESTIHPYIDVCLEDFKKYNTSNCVLIGGLAVSYYLKPRETQDINLIFLSEDEIPNYIEKFKRTRKHSFLHLETHVEVEVLTSDFLNINLKTVEMVFADSRVVDGIKVASPVSLIALKLNRFNDRDQLDIKELIQYCIENEIEMNLDDYNLPENCIIKLKSLKISDINEKNSYYMETEFSLRNSKYEKMSTDNLEVYVFNESAGDPRFHVFFDNQRYCIDIENQEVMDSTTDYKTLPSNVETFIKHNMSWVRNTWNELNEKKDILIHENIQ